MQPSPEGSRESNPGLPQSIGSGGLPVVETLGIGVKTLTNNLVQVEQAKGRISIPNYGRNWPKDIEANPELWNEVAKTLPSVIAQLAHPVKGMSFEEAKAIFSERYGEIHDDDIVIESPDDRKRPITIKKNGDGSFSLHAPSRLFGMKPPKVGSQMYMGAEWIIDKNGRIVDIIEMMPWGMGERTYFTYSYKYTPQGKMISQEISGEGNMAHQSLKIQDDSKGKPWFMSITSPYPDGGDYIILLNDFDSWMEEHRNPNR